MYFHIPNLKAFTASSKAVHSDGLQKREELYRTLSNDQNEDLRERSFLVMCDESKMIGFKALMDYIVLRYGDKKPSRKTVRRFFDSMKPNANGMVSFSKFIRAIDADGDVVAAFKRFRKSGRSRSTKNV